MEDIVFFYCYVPLLLYSAIWYCITCTTVLTPAGAGYSRPTHRKYTLPRIPTSKLISGGNSRQWVFPPVGIPVSGHSRRESLSYHRLMPTWLFPGLRKLPNVAWNLERQGNWPVYILKVYIKYICKYWILNLVFAQYFRYTLFRYTLGCGTKLGLKQTKRVKTIKSI